MTCVLMLDFDRRLVSAVARVLLDHAVTVVGTARLDDAVAALHRQHFDAALLDGDVLEREELSLFSRLPLILTTSFLEPEGGHRFFDKAPLLRKPFTSAQLLSALHDACGVNGSAPTGLVDMLRRAHDLRRSLALEVGGAIVIMEQGELVHAELGSITGEPALAEVLARSANVPRPIAAHNTVRTIQRPFQTLLLDLLREIEERERERALQSARDTLIPGDRGPRP